MLKLQHCCKKKIALSRATKIAWVKGPYIKTTKNTNKIVGVSVVIVAVPCAAFSFLVFL